MMQCARDLCPDEVEEKCDRVHVFKAAMIEALF